MSQHAFNRHSTHYFLSLNPVFMDIDPEPSSNPLDVDVAFNADSVADGPVDTSSSIVARDVTTMVIVKANISKDVATDSGESAAIGDIITSSNATAEASTAIADASRYLMTGLVIDVPLSLSPRADLGEGDITPIPPIVVIGDETNPPAPANNVLLSDYTRMVDVIVLRIEISP
ncbi:hypothetical protein GUJ93_ZPchr0001g32460 [Zizania palustris]|uniref:Uncharacterized protein n=1 Tax=Zizania palustris TaxID=103762 RepID=A0A8J5UZZ7_ZIZPA|nr:hypothetical protein GUJ93_ZPchr0001g32460 [Zizania palustris]